jgi:hypothetical protein
MSQKPLVPPRFAIAAAQFLYDPNLPDHLYRTYARITGLAWQKRDDTGTTYVKTPPLTVYELAVICNLSVRNMWRQINDLVGRGLLAWETEMAVQKRMVFYPVWPDGAAQAGRHLAAAGQAEDASPATAAPPGETQQALAEFGVDVQEPLAQQVAAQPHVTPALVRAWGTSLRQQPGIRNLPGLLLHILHTTAEPPPKSQAAPVDGQPPPSAPPPALPPLPNDLRQALCALGWSGDDAWAEVAAVAARDLELVRAWVRYVADHPHLGAGFLRAQLRGTTWPSQEEDAAQRRRERWRKEWQEQQSDEAAQDGQEGEQEEGDPGLSRLASRREEVMERYGITPEAMALWPKVQAELALQMTRATYDTCLRNALLLAVEDGRATLGVRQAHAVDWLQNRLGRAIRRTLACYAGRPVEELSVVVLDGVGEGAEG